jgi:Asp/Glu/hydantoin racemase
MTELERDMKERIERLTREIEARNAACKQYAYDIACLTDKVRALHVEIDNLTKLQPEGCKGAVTTTVNWHSVGRLG